MALKVVVTATAAALFALAGVAAAQYEFGQEQRRDGIEREPQRDG